MRTGSSSILVKPNCCECLVLPFLRIFYLWLWMDWRDGLNGSRGFLFLDSQPMLEEQEATPAWKVFIQVHLLWQLDLSLDEEPSLSWSHFWLAILMCPAWGRPWRPLKSYHWSGMQSHKQVLLCSCNISALLPIQDAAYLHLKALHDRGASWGTVSLPQCLPNHSKLASSIVM